MIKINNFSKANEFLPILLSTKSEGGNIFKDKEV